MPEDYDGTHEQYAGKRGRSMTLKDARAAALRVAADTEAAIAADRAADAPGDCDCAFLGQQVAGLAGSLELATSEKHGAQADAEREKNVADGLRLRITELEQGIASANSVAQIRYEQITKNNADATRRIEELEATCAGLRETLQPFAEKIPDLVLDHETWKLYRTAGQIRNAAAALIASPAEHRQRIEAPLLERIAELETANHELTASIEAVKFPPSVEMAVDCATEQLRERERALCQQVAESEGQLRAAKGHLANMDRRIAGQRAEIKNRIHSEEMARGQAKEATEQVERLREQLAAHIRIRDGERAMEAGRIEAAERRGMERAAEIACLFSETNSDPARVDEAQRIKVAILAGARNPAPRCDAECAAAAAKEPK